MAGNCNIFILSVTCGKSEGHQRKISTEAIGVQWTNDNTRIMLETIKEWLFLCHDNREMEDVLGCSQPLWEEVAYKLSRRFNKCPQICWQYFIRVFMIAFILLVKMVTVVRKYLNFQTLLFKIALMQK